jgi:maltoporin
MPVRPSAKQKLLTVITCLLAIVALNSLSAQDTEPTEIQLLKEQVQTLLKERQQEQAEASEIQRLRQEVEALRKERQERPPESSEVQLLREEVEALRKERQENQQRIATMEAQMKSIETKVILTASAIQSRQLKGPDGKEISLDAPVVIPPLSSFTRNFVFQNYTRAGVGFTGNGVGQTSSFVLPEFGTGRFRLGNENDTFFELIFNQHHLLGDDPDQMDVSFRTKIAIVDGVDKRDGVFMGASGFDTGLQEIFLMFKNVIKSAPGITFWGGQRQYDQYDIHGSDYSILNAGGYGAGVYNIDTGIGALGIAYFGSTINGIGNAQSADFNQFRLDVPGGEGSIYRHTLDLRLGDIPVLGGKLKLVGLGSYQQGGDFTSSAGANGHVDNSFGLGGAAVYIYEFGKFSFLNLNAYYGWGVVNAANNIESAVDLNKLNGAYQSALLSRDLPPGSFADVDPYNNSQRARASAHFVWNPTDNFSLATWLMYQYDDQGFTPYQEVDGTIRSASAATNVVGVGIRPVWWIWGPFALQGQAGYSYVDNVRSGAAFGDSGSLAVFTICPTIKPRGGYFTRPELRLYATYAIWSDSLMGSIGAPYYINATDGWNFGAQIETWF